MNQTKEVDIKHKAILVTINQLYHPRMNPLELYEATRGVWRLSQRREKAEYVMAVYQGEVKEVYRVKRWLPAGTLEYTTRKDVYKPEYKGRWEFEGEVANDIRDLYVGKYIGTGGQNPVKYVNT